MDYHLRTIRGRVIGWQCTMPTPATVGPPGTPPTQLLQRETGFYRQHIASDRFRRAHQPRGSGLLRRGDQRGRESLFETLFETHREWVRQSTTPDPLEFASKNSAPSSPTRPSESCSPA